jgi:hypothetical protein
LRREFGGDVWEFWLDVKLSGPTRGFESKACNYLERSTA